MNNRLTIVKVIGKDDVITSDELEKWRDIFREHKMTDEEAVATGEVFVEYVPIPNEDEHCITLVKLGSEHYTPSFEDFESYRNAFKQAAENPNIKIFATTDMEVSVIQIGKIIAVK